MRKILIILITGPLLFACKDSKSPSRVDQSESKKFTPGWSMKSEENIKQKPEQKPGEPLGQTDPDYVPVRRQWREIPASAYPFDVPSNQAIAKWREQFEKANDADSVWFNDYQRCGGMERWLTVNDFIELWYGPNRPSGQDDARTLWRLLQYDPDLEQMPNSRGDRILHIRGIIDTLLDYDAGSQMDLNLYACLQNDLHDYYCRIMLRSVLLAAPADLSSALRKEERAWRKYFEQMSDVYEHLYGSPEGLLGSGWPMFRGHFLEMHLALRKDSLEGLMLALLGSENAITSCLNSNDVVTSKMIDEEYRRYAEGIDDEYGYPVAVQRKALSKDQQAWKAWIASRSAVSFLLPAAAKAVYDNSTEVLLCHKFDMLKNRYEAPND